MYFKQNLLPMDLSNWGPHGPTDLEATGYAGGIFPKLRFHWMLFIFNTFYTKKGDRFVIEETCRDGVGMLM